MAPRVTEPADPLAALTAQVASAPGQPLVTYYDGATGERVELSAVTTDNWVTKIANLLADELMLDPGARIAVELPTHWQTAVLVLGAWAAGLTVSAPGSDVDVRAVGPNGPRAYADQPRADTVVACSLQPLSGRFATPLPAGWLDFATAVPPQPDLLVEARAMADPCVHLGELVSSPGELLSRGREAASRAGLQQHGRLLTDLSPAAADGLVGGLTAALAVGASLVLLSNGDTATRDSVAAQEQVTATSWSAPASP